MTVTKRNAIEHETKKHQIDSAAPAVMTKNEKNTNTCCQQTRYMLQNIAYFGLWEVFYVAYWQAVLIGITWIHHQVISWTRGIWTEILFAVIAVFYTILLTLYTRYWLFEIYWSKMPYITPRETGTDLHNTSAGGLYHYLWILLAAIMFSHVKIDLKGSYILNGWDHIVLLALWMATDTCFYFYHRFNHLYLKKIHKIHHSCALPTSCKNVEEFHAFDACGHVICFLIGAKLLCMTMEISNEVWLIGMMQWIIIGQLQHGGKAVDGTSWIFMLEPLRKLVGLKEMALLHDHHHTSGYPVNFGMTGHCDYLGGSLLQ